MISIREKRDETIVIQNNKLIYGLAINTCLLFFTFSGIFNILKNNIVQVYLDTVLIFICHFLFRYFSKFRKKTFIKINSQKLEILSTSKRRTFLLKDIKKVQIEKIKLRREIPYIVKLELKNEDCLVYLKSIPDNSIDLILIDPPYKISRDTGFANGEEKGTDVDRFRVSYQFGNWDNSRDILPQVIKEAYRVLKKHGSIVCFYDLWKITDLRKWLEKNNFKQIRFAEWIKTNPVPINSKLNYLTNSREAIITGVKVSKPTFNSSYDNGIYSHPINHEKGRFHPTQKPVKLIEELILKHSNENDIVLDCFSGSGTTMLACNNLNRRFMGCELSPKYFYKSIKRIQKNTSN